MASLPLRSSACSFHNMNSSLRPSTLKRKFSCKARHDPTDHDKHPTFNNRPLTGGVDRRNILIGLSGAAAGLTLTDRKAYADPIKAPDISDCGPASLPSDTECCPPSKSTIIDFKPQGTPSPLRVRPAAHLATPAYIEKYKKAVELMKALPADDPRNFTQQANVHCAYCGAAYDQIGFPGVEIQVHQSWLFFPWHRFYMYFNERILGKLIGDDSFALPYWNWDAPGGMTMPAMYTDPSSSLYDALRDAAHQPPEVVDLALAFPDDITDEQKIDLNLMVMYRQMISNGKTAELFMGSTYRAGDPPNPGPGSLENVPHGPVHVWTGDRTQPNGEDMGVFYSAARDPIFFAHHGNIDRLWSVWKTLGGKREDFNDSDWHEASFLFYDENAQLVRVKVKDCLDSEALGYRYQDVDLPWLNTPPKPNIAPASMKPSDESAATQAEATFPLVLQSVVTITVQRPKMNRSEKEKEEAEEVLAIDNIQFDRNKFIQFDVCINSPDHKGVGPGSAEFAGSFVNVPHSYKMQAVVTKLKLGITDLIDDLGANGDKALSVTLVPKNGTVTIGGIGIEFSS